MTWLMKRLVRLYPETLRHEFGDEMAEVLLDRYRELRSRGRYEALRGFWLREARAILRAQVSELARGARAGSFLGDLRVSVRALASSPGFSLAAVLLLSLAVGTSTAAFSVMEAVLLAPLPFDEPQELVLAFETNAERGWTRAQVAPANFLDWRDRTTKLTSVTAYNDFLTELVLDREGEPVRVRASRVFGNFFDVLGVRLRAGRGFTVAESYRGSHRVAVLSDAIARAHFGLEPDVIGKTILLEGESFLVVGLAPASLRFPFEGVDLWIPMGWDEAGRDEVSFRRAHSLRSVARLGPGVAISEASAELEAIALELSRDYPGTNEGMGVGLLPLRDWVVGDVRASLLLLSASVLIVLLVACANVSSLFLVRFSRREAEMSLRAALGAGFLALARLAVVESALIAILSGSLGVLLAGWAIPSLVALAPPGIPRLETVGINPAVLAFALCLIFATALVCGLLPALKAARSAQPARRFTAARASRSPARWLVAFEVALAVVLSMAAVLLARSFENQRRVDPGFDLTSVTTATLRLPSHRYQTPEDAIAFARQMLERVRSLPGVSSASLAGRALLNPGWSSDFTTETWGPEQYGVGVRHRQVAPDYFETLRVPLVAGRAFNENDAMGTPPVVVINEALADTYFPGEDPVGRRICYDRVPSERSYWRTIVGVVGNERHGGLLQRATPMFIEPLFQGEIGRTQFLHVRATGDSLSGSIRTLVAEIDASVPVYDVERGEAVLERALVRERFLLTLMSLFAASGLLLSVAGIQSVLSFAVTRREKEIGIRMALGARARHVTKLVFEHGLVVAGAGTASGIVVGLLLARFIASLLYGVAPSDAAAIAIVAALVMSASILAAIGPAVRAARIDPIQSIRTE